MPSIPARRSGDAFLQILRFADAMCIFGWMQKVADIFAVWPSDADLGRDIGMPYRTVSAWKQRGSIPAPYWREIIAAARRRGYPEITADLLVDLHARTSELPSGFGEEERRFEAPSGGERQTPAPTPVGAGHFSRFKHLRRDHFRTAQEIEEHIRALRDEWSHR
jgi:hypothetical protein